MDSNPDALIQRLHGAVSSHRHQIDAAIRQFGLPIHVFFLSELRRQADAFRTVLDRHYPRSTVCFAVKSNPCRGALRAVRRLGLGADTASEHELRAALEEGIAPERIVCNGNAKTDEYLVQAVTAGAMIALDNDDELVASEQAARRAARETRVLLRFRGMPLAGFTSDDQTTASEWTKFGFHIDESPRLFDRLATSKFLHLAGISAHIGTQIADPRGYEQLLDSFLSLADSAVTHGCTLELIDLGGGFPVSFLSQPAWEDFQGRLRERLEARVSTDQGITWNDIPMGFAPPPTGGSLPERWIGKSYWTAYPDARMLEHLLTHPSSGGRTTVDRLRDLGSPRLVIEPGRSLVAPAGVTVAEVMGVKDVLGHHVVALDMGINNHGTNLISPDIFPAAVLPRDPEDKPVEAFLAGRLCFSGDMISKAKVPLNRLPRRGERLALYLTGAYCADHFASNSCGFPVPAKVAVAEDGHLEVWRAPQQYEEVWRAPQQCEEALGDLALGVLPPD